MARMYQNKIVNQTVNESVNEYNFTSQTYVPVRESHFRSKMKTIKNNKECNDCLTFIRHYN